MDEATEVVAGGGENSVIGVAPTEPEIVAAHSVLGFEMADNGLDGGPAAQLALDAGRHPSLLAGEEDPEPVIGRRVVAAVSLVGKDACDGVADERLHVRDHGCQRVAVIGIAGQRLHMSDELAALAVLEGGGNAHLDAELVRPMSLAFADAFDFRRMQGIDLRPALMLLLLVYAPRQQQQLCERHFEPAGVLDLAANVANDAAEIGAQLLEHPVGALELLGMGITLMLDQSELADPRIGLTQPHSMALRQPHQLLARPVQKLRIGGERRVLGLNRRIDDDPRQLGGLDRLGPGGNRQALLDQRLQPTPTSSQPGGDLRHLAPYAAAAASFNPLPQTRFPANSIAPTRRFQIPNQ
jgi:hypothetical protein